MTGTYLQTPNGISLYIRGEQHVVSADHDRFEDIMVAVKEQRWQDALSLIDATRRLREILEAEEVTVEGAILYYEDRPFPISLSQKALRLSEVGDGSLQPLIRFAKKVRMNPSYVAQEETILFMEANGMLLHEDGDIIAFKGTTDDFMSIHSNPVTGEKVNWAPGEIVTEPRNEVDDNRQNTCSRGLHFASKGFADGWGQRTVVLKINPRDVVSIPYDYNNQKGRCCRAVSLRELEDREDLESMEFYTNEFFAIPKDQFVDFPDEDLEDDYADEWDDPDWDDDDDDWYDDDYGWDDFEDDEDVDIDAEIRYLAQTENLGRTAIVNRIADDFNVAVTEYYVRKVLGDPNASGH